MSEKRRNWLVAPKLHKLVVVARSLREGKPPQENGWWDEEKLVQEEKERAGAIDCDATAEDPKVDDDAEHHDSDISEGSWD